MPFDEQNRPVASVDFDYDAIDGREPDESEADSSEARELTLTRMVFAIALSKDVRIDGLHAHLGALALLIRVPGFSSAKEVAQRLKVSESSVRRAHKRLIRELSESLDSSILTNVYRADRNANSK